MWKDFFYYSKSERIALIVLLLLMALFVTGEVYFTSISEKRREENLYVSVQEEEQFLASLKEKEKLRRKNYLHSQQRKRTAQQHQIKHDINVNKQLPKLFVSSKDSIKHSLHDGPSKFERRTLVDANLADTMILKRIPGIGRVIARYIVRYRERLGGFYSLEQLNEVRFFKPELLPWFTLSNVKIRTIPINKASLSTLCKHPYLNYAQAKVIFRHREKEGPIKNLSQLSLYEEFTEKDLKRLSPYFSFE